MNPNQQPLRPNENQPQWSYTSGNLVEQDAQNNPYQSNVDQPQDNGQSIIAWTASEFVEHDKSKAWYVRLILAALLLSAVIFIITRQIFSVVVVMLMAIVFGVYGSAKPKVLNYAVTAQGLQIADKMYPFNTIKSYSVIDEGGLPYIQILFQKRLSVPVAVYAAPDQLEQVAEAIGQFVPYDQKKRDLADRLSSKIRF